MPSHFVRELGTSEEIPNKIEICTGYSIRLYKLVQKLLLPAYRYCRDATSLRARLSVFISRWEKLPLSDPLGANSTSLCAPQAPSEEVRNVGLARWRNGAVRARVFQKTNQRGLRGLWSCFSAPLLTDIGSCVGSCELMPSLSHSRSCPDTVRGVRRKVLR
mgnify:CR=1 FL=1|jgi:hypothetical protein